MAEAVRGILEGKSVRLAVFKIILYGAEQQIGCAGFIGILQLQQAVAEGAESYEGECFVVVPCAALGNITSAFNTVRSEGGVHRLKVDFMVNFFIRCKFFGNRADVRAEIGKV